MWPKTSSMTQLFTQEMLAKATEPAQSPFRRIQRGVDPDTGSSVIVGIHANGARTVLAVHIIPDRKPSAECECDVEHSITKLGHSRSCPWFRRAQPTMITRGVLKNGCGCPPTHADGTPHDFDWATYSDDFESYGVCYCGLDGMSFDLMAS
jgi:hypothetical protein